MIVSSIAASALPKAALAITLSLHPASAHHQHHYTVKAGDSLASVATHKYGAANRWPALWWVNRNKIKNPNAIRAGMRLRLSPWHPRRDWLDHAAMAAIPAPPPPPMTAAPAAGPAAPAAPAQSYSGASGSFEQCVIQRESGGDPGAVNGSSGAGGLYGFLPSTWASLGFSGLPQNASAATQQQAFQKAYAQSGSAPWSAYDGC
jgi:resuscitation-promoting factor RpfC